MVVNGIWFGVMMFFCFSCWGVVKHSFIHSGVMTPEITTKYSTACISLNKKKKKKKKIKQEKNLTNYLNLRNATYMNSHVGSRAITRAVLHHCRSWLDLATVIRQGLGFYSQSQPRWSNEHHANSTQSEREIQFPLRREVSCCWRFKLPYTELKHRPHFPLRRKIPRRAFGFFLAQEMFRWMQSWIKVHLFSFSFFIISLSGLFHICCPCKLFKIY